MLLPYLIVIGLFVDTQESILLLFVLCLTNSYAYIFRNSHKMLGQIQKKGINEVIKSRKLTTSVNSLYLFFQFFTPMLVFTFYLSLREGYLLWQWFISVLFACIVQFFFMLQTQTFHLIAISRWPDFHYFLRYLAMIFMFLVMLFLAMAPKTLLGWHFLLLINPVGVSSIWSLVFIMEYLTILQGLMVLVVWTTLALSFWLFTRKSKPIELILGKRDLFEEVDDA